MENSEKVFNKFLLGEGVVMHTMRGVGLNKVSYGGVVE